MGTGAGAGMWWVRGQVFNLTVDPTVLRWGPLALGWGSLLTTLALLLGGTRFLAAGRRAGLDPARLERVVVWALLGGVIGGRLLFVADHARYFWAEPWQAPAVWQGGLALDGALLGGAVALLVAGRDWAPRWRLLGLAVPAMLAGLAVGWIGPFLTGSAVGRPTGGSWGLIYWHPDALVPPALLGVPTQPYAVYAAAWCLLLLALLRLGGSRLTRPGDIVLAGGAGLALGQFVLAFALPGPAGMASLWGLSLAQLQALGLAVLAAAGWCLARGAAGLPFPGRRARAREVLEWVVQR